MSHVSIKPLLITYPSFAELPIEQVVQRARHEKWLEVQILVRDNDTNDTILSESLADEKADYVRQLIAQLPEYAIWNDRFDGVDRLFLWRFGTDEEVEEYLSILMEAIRIYRELANRLMHRLAAQLGEDITKFSVEGYWHPHRQSGTLHDDGNGVLWEYFFHGLDCAFGNQERWIKVEARLCCATLSEGDFGVIERHFFWDFLSAYARREVRFSPLVELCHSTKRVWDAYCIWRGATIPSPFIVLLKILEQRGLLRVVTVHRGIPWDWIVE